MDKSNLEKCHVFICYRQQDGLAAADWLYHHLHGRTIKLERSNETLQLDVYLDRDAPAVDDWQEIWLPKLQVARALLFVCTPSAAKRRDGTDWVYRELDKWIAMRQSGPIVIDATGDAEKYLPRIIQERWPNAQRIVCRPEAWEQLSEAERHREAERMISRILRGIRISEEGYWLEELERLKALNRKLVRRLAAVVVLFGLAVVLAILSYVYQVRAEREANIATAGQMTATSEFLRQQDGSSLETSVLLATRAHELQSEVGAPSVAAWRALSKGIALLPGKVGRPMYPFGPDISARAYIGKNAVLFVRQRKAPVGDDQAVLWSYDKGGGAWRRVRRFNALEHGEIVRVNADGSWIVTKKPDGFTVWNTLDGEVVSEIPMSNEDDQVSAVTLSPAGRWLGLVAGDEFLVYDLRSESETPPRSFTIGWPVYAVFSPNEQQLAFANRKRLILYSLENGAVLRQTEMPPGTDQVDPPTFSPDGEYIAIHLASNQTFQTGASATPGGVNHKVYVWRVSAEFGRSTASAAADWKPYETIVREGPFDVVFAQTRNTPRLAILERDQPVQVLDLFSKVSFTLSAGEQGAHNAAFKLGELLTVNRDGTARLWDTKKRIELRRLTHRRPIREAHLLPGRGWGGAQVLTISDVGEVRLWGRPKESVVDATGYRRVMKWSLSGDYILSADNFASRIDARTGKEVQIQLNIKSGHNCVAGALSPDGRHAVFATKWLPPGQPQTLRLVDLSGEKEQINLPLERRVEVKDLAVALGGTPVLATTQLGAVLVWTPEATSEEERLRVFYSAETESKAIRKTSIVLLDPDGGSFLRVVGGDNTTLIRRSNSGKILGELQLRTRWDPRRARSSWQRSNSGVYLSLSAEDGQYFLVETRTLVSTKITPPEKAQLLQVDNDGRLLLRSKESFLVVNKSGAVLYRIPDSSIHDTGRLGGDGRLLVVVESDGEVTVWDMENGLPLAGLTADDNIGGAMFGPGGDHLILLYPRSFRMRQWKGEALVRVASALIGRELTQDEWQTHVGDTQMR